MSTNPESSTNDSPERNINRRPNEEKFIEARPTDVTNSKPGSSISKSDFAKSTNQSSSESNSRGTNFNSSLESKYTTQLYSTIAANIRTRKEKELIIEVLPDTRSILHHALQDFTHGYDKMLATNNPTITTLSLTGYTAIILYAYLWLEDRKLGINESSHSKDAFSFRDQLHIEQVLRNLQIPKILIPFLQELQETRLTYLQEIRFVATLGCYNLEYDGGRIIPPFVYFNAHNMLNETSFRQQARKLLYTPCVTRGNNSAEVYIGNIIAITNTTATRYSSNVLCHSILQACSPTNKKSQVTSKVTYSTLTSTPYNPSGTFNPYEFYLNMWPQVRSETIHFLRDASNFIKESGTFDSTRTLGDFIEQSSPETLTKHMTANFIKPTWLRQEIVGNDSVSATELQTDIINSEARPATNASEVTRFDLTPASATEILSTVTDENSNANTVVTTNTVSLPIYTQDRLETDEDIEVIFRGLNVSTPTGFVTTSLSGKIISIADPVSIVDYLPNCDESISNDRLQYNEIFIRLKDTVAQFAKNSNFFSLEKSVPSFRKPASGTVHLGQSNYTVIGGDVRLSNSQSFLNRAPHETNPTINVISQKTPEAVSRTCVAWSSYRTRRGLESTVANIEIALTLLPLIGRNVETAYARDEDHLI